MLYGQVVAWSFGLRDVSRWFRAGAGALPLVLGIVLVLASPLAASAGRAPKIMSVSQLPAPDLAANMSAVQPDYLIGPFDTLEIKVYPDASLGGEVQVAANGKIDLPLIGVVVASAKTPRQLGQEIAAKLGASYLVSPTVAVEIKDSASLKYTVAGEVEKPGIYNVLGQVTLMQAIATAEGVSEFANEHRLIIYRTINNKRAAAIVDLADIAADKVEDPQIYPGDIIVVPNSKSRRVLQDIGRLAPVLLFLRPVGF